MQLEESLRILGFKEIPDEPTLKEQFISLLKENHPDKHGNNSTSNDRTRRILESFRVLSKYAPRSRKPFQLGFSSRPSTFYQMIDCGDANLAIPVDWIEEIILFHQGRFEKIRSKKYLVRNQLLYSMRSLGFGEKHNPRDFVVLIATAGRRLALCLPSHATFLSPVHFTPQEVEYSITESKIYSDRKYYTIPSWMEASQNPILPMRKTSLRSKVS